VHNWGKTRRKALAKRTTTSNIASNMDSQHT